MKKNTWQLQDAKSKFSQVVERAMRDAPQFVTKHGNRAVVVLSIEDYKKLTKPKKDLVTFLKASPLVGVDLVSSRSKDLPREVEL